MRTRLLFLPLFLLLLAGGHSNAQPVYAYTSASTIANTIPFNNSTNNLRQWVYYPSDFGAPSGIVTKLYLRSETSSAANFGNLTIKMGHSTLTTFTAGPWATGLTTVFNGPASLVTVTGNWMVIPLSTPFAYNNTQNLIIEASQTAGSPGFSVMQANVGVIARSIFGNLGSPTGSTQDRLAECGFEMLCTAPPTAGTAVYSPNPACPGHPVTLDLAGFSGGGGQTYQWQEATLPGGPYNNIGTSQPVSDYTFTPSATNYYRCILTCSGLSDTSAVVQLNLAPPLPASVSIVSDTNDFCYGTAATFTATPVNGGLAPDYQWKRNGVNVGTNSDMLSLSNLLDDDTVSCVMTSSEFCVLPVEAVSNKIVMIVESKLPTSVVVDAVPSNSICQGDSVTFTATPVNGGTAPVYQWKKNGVNVGINSSVYGDGSLQNNDLIRCEMSSSEECVTQPTTAHALLVKVNDSPDKPFITFNSNVLTSSKTALHYQWLLNGNILLNDTLQSVVAIDSGWYSVILTNEHGCSVTSNPVFNWGVVGVEEQLNGREIAVYPSPFHDELTIELKTATAGARVEVRSMTGQLLHSAPLSQGINRLDLAFLEKGIYMVTVDLEGQTIVKRVVRQ